MASTYEKIYSPQVHRRKARSKSVQFDLYDTKPSMPPPPPRPRTASVGSIPTYSLQQQPNGLPLPPRSGAIPFAEKNRSRPRAESLDESKRSSEETFDPTVEFELCATRSAEETLELRRVERQLPFRKRSVSCSLTYEATPVCETIMEEP
mmetsp:Transcript_19534/g.28531  ORF Transcript_19534/g.28531 Transcript_19534/m.28531 type:complete len:150 (+) Transcript_19534:476-925(+)